MSENVYEPILNRSHVDGQSTYPTALESIEHPGYLTTYHPKPDEYSPADWFHMVKCLHTSQGHIVKDVLAAVEFEPDPHPYPLKRKQLSWGVEVIWTPGRNRNGTSAN